jgi:hypothetical protein
MRSLTCAPLLAIALAASGCMEITYDINLKEDGSGQLVEVFKLGPKVLRLAENAEGGAAISAQLLSEARCKERAKDLGKDVELTAFKVEDTVEGGRKLTAVYSFRDINAVQLCPFPVAKDWQLSRMTFSYWVTRDPKSRWYNFTTGQTNWKGDRYAAGPVETISETELQKVRRLLPVFKDMLGGFKLAVNFQFETPQQWASAARGVGNSFHMNQISMAGGRVPLLDLDENKLLETDDALMILVPWRQENAENKIHGLFRWPSFYNGETYLSGRRFRWAYIQFADRREYF